MLFTKSAKNVIHEMHLFTVSPARWNH